CRGSTAQSTRCTPCPAGWPSTTDSRALPCRLSLHDALPIYSMPCAMRPAVLLDLSRRRRRPMNVWGRKPETSPVWTWRVLLVPRSEEHTSELQSRFDLVCRLLLAKNKGPVGAKVWRGCVMAG